MNTSTLDRARGGDEHAFGELVAPHLRELHVHCYRMLGSTFDAEDLLQETLTAAWSGLDTFAGRSSLRAWLYRIATNRCLNAIRDGRRRIVAEPIPPFDPPEPTRRDSIRWLTPWVADPADHSTTRETIELAFIVALQRMPPRQTAALLLCDVLGFPLAEVATLLDTTPTAVKGALQRARRARPASPPTEAATESELARRFAAAYAADDVDAVVALLTDEAWLVMPPAPHEYHGPDAIGEFLRTSARWRAGRHFRLSPVVVNTQLGFRCTLDGEPAGMVVLTVRGTRISAITGFLRA